MFARWSCAAAVVGNRLAACVTGSGGYDDDDDDRSKKPPSFASAPLEKLRRPAHSRRRRVTYVFRGCRRLKLEFGDKKFSGRFGYSRERDP